MTARSHNVLREASVRIPPKQNTVWTKIGLAGSTIEAPPAVEARIDEDPIAKMELIIACFDQFPDHLVPHDQRVANRDRAFVDFQIRAADAAIGHPHQDLIVTLDRPFDLAGPQVTRGS